MSPEQLEVKRIRERGYRQQNPEKIREQTRERNERYRATHAERVRKNRATSSRKRHKENPEGRQSHHFKNRYNITLITYNTLIDGQGFVCAICEAPDFTRDKPLCVDHDHSTGWVRGLLCDACNHGLGRFKDSPALLDKAASYLRFHKRDGKLHVRSAR